VGTVESTSGKGGEIEIFNEQEGGRGGTEAWAILLKRRGRKDGRGDKADLRNAGAGRHKKKIKDQKGRISTNRTSKSTEVGRGKTVSEKSDLSQESLAPGGS